MGGGIGIFGSLHIAREGLFAQQSAIGVTAHNVANVNTPGYSRQRAVFEPVEPQQIAGLYFGRGVTIDAITKSYDKFLNNNIMLETSILGQWEIRSSYMNQADSIFNESSEMGLNSLMNEFWQAWQDLADHPEGIPERAIVQSQARTLAGAFQSMTANLESIRTDANSRIADVVNKINQLSQEIAELNNQVLGTQTSNSNPNDLTDQRTLKIEELSSYIDITVIEEGDGQTTVMTSSGKPLVSENLYWSLQAKADPERENFFSVQYLANGTATDMTERIQSGHLNGLLAVRDEIVPAYLDKLDHLAASLVTEVNRVHSQGYGLNGMHGQSFFQALEVLTRAATDNSGGGSLYDAAVTDQSLMKPGDYSMTFLNDFPGTTTYELYDATDEEYVFTIDAGNASLLFSDSADGTTVSTAALQTGTYTGDELATELEAQLEAASSTGQNYSVSWDGDTRLFTITNHGTNDLTLQWDDSQTLASRVLGFAQDASLTIAADESASSDFQAGTYAAAAVLFEIDGTSSDILFDDNSGGGPFLLSLQTGVYTVEELRGELERVLEAGGAGNGQYTVAFDSARHFTITADSNPSGNVSLLWSDAQSTAASVLGYDTAADMTLDPTDPAANEAAGDYAAGDVHYLERQFAIEENVNDAIVFDDGGIGDGTGGTSVTARLDEGVYSGEELAALIEQALEQSPGSAGQDYIVTYDVQQGQFSVINHSGNMHALTIDWDPATSTAATTIGFTAGTATVAVGAADVSDERVGDFLQYHEVSCYGISAKFANEDGRPRAGDVFQMDTITDAARRIDLDPLAGADPEYLAAALDVFDITGQNNVLMFNNDGDTFGGAVSRVEIETGRYTGDELAAAIQQQLEGTGADMFYIDPGVNTAIRFDDGAGVCDATIALAAGHYTGEQVAAAVESALEAASGVAQFTVSYSSETKRFTIDVDATNGGDVALTWSDTVNTTAAELLGFQRSDTTGLSAGTRDTGDFGVHQSYAVTWDSEARTFSIANNSADAPDLVLLVDHPDSTMEYLLGFNEQLFTVAEGVNDTLVYSCGGGADETITLTPGRYSGTGLAAAMQDQLNDDLEVARYLVAYDPASHQFTVTNDGGDDLTLQWSDAATTCAALMGFDAVDDTIADGASIANDWAFGRITGGSSAVSDFATGGAHAGDNRNALLIAGLKDIGVMNGGTITLDDFYNILVSSVGTDVASTNNNIEHQTFMVDQLEERRQSIAGVSLDEEMINLIKYQQAYNASAKLVSTLDTMLDQLLTLKR